MKLTNLSYYLLQTSTSFILQKSAWVGFQLMFIQIYGFNFQRLWFLDGVNSIVCVTKGGRNRMGLSPALKAEWIDYAERFDKAKLESSTYWDFGKSSNVLLSLSATFSWLHILEMMVWIALPTEHSIVFLSVSPSAVAGSLPKPVGSVHMDLFSYTNIRPLPQN